MFLPTHSAPSSIPLSRCILTGALGAMRSEFAGVSRQPRETHLRYRTFTNRNIAPARIYHAVPLVSNPTAA